jgi:hypothetical protein
MTISILPFFHRPSMLLFAFAGRGDARMPKMAVKAMKNLVILLL